MARLVAAGNARRCPTSRGAPGQRGHGLARASPAGNGVGRAAPAGRIGGAGSRLYPEPARERARLVAHPHHRRRRPLVYQRRLRRLPPRAPRRVPARAAFRCWSSTRATRPTRRSGDRHASRPASRGDDRRRHRPDPALAPHARGFRRARRPDDGAHRRSDRHEYRAVAARGRHAAAADYLIDLGHRRIANITAPARRARAHGGSTASSRPSDARPRHGAHGRHRRSARRASPSAAELFGELIARWPDLDAVFCGNDYLALGCLFECERRGIRVPEDISLVGFNDARVLRQFLSRRSPRSRRRATRWRAAPRRSSSKSSAARASGRSSAGSTSAFASCSATAPAESHRPEGITSAPPRYGHRDSRAFRRGAGPSSAAPLPAAAA